MGKSKRGICLALACMILVQSTVVHATTISELKEKNKQDNQTLSELNSQIEELTGERDGVKDEIAGVSAQITDMLASIDILENDISNIKDEIEVCKSDLEKAIIEEEKQKNAMMARIKYMYEEGNTSILSLLLSANGLSEVLNRADYIENIYVYDHEMLDAYKKARQEVEDLKAELEEQEAELEVALDEFEGEKEGLEVALSELKTLSKEYDNLIGKATREAAVVKKQIEQQNAQIKKLEAEEARKRAAEAAKTAAGTAKVDAASIRACKGSDKGKDIAIYACSFVGNPYVLGGTSLTKGADCSGFTQSVYKNYGITIPRTSYQQRSAGKEVAYADAEPGDLICYAGHVAMYIGNGRIVHASSAKTGIKLGYATYRQILSVRRIL